MIPRLCACMLAFCLGGGDAVALGEVRAGIAAAGCAPSNLVTRFNRHAITDGSVRHASGNVDTIVLTCPVVPFDSDRNNWRLRLIYQDSTGAAAAAFVRAMLYRLPVAVDVPIDPPASTPIVMAAANSNAAAATNNNVVESGPFNHRFQFHKNVYWIRIEMDRSLTDQAVAIHAVYLVGQTVLSDLRAKRDIRMLGRLDNGLGFYRFRYLDDDAVHVGVMAQEVEAVRPDAVMRGGDGYLRVDYERLGLTFQRWEDWVAAGETIPVIAPLQRQGARP